MSVRGGSDGTFCEAKVSTVTTVGDDFVPANSSLFLSIFCFGRLGGRGGRVEGLKAGGTIRPASIDGVLEADVLAVPLDIFDIFEIVERFETVEAIDSLESLRPRAPDGLLGGKDGDACTDGVRGGNFGGGVGRVGFDTS